VVGVGAVWQREWHGSDACGSSEASGDNEAAEIGRKGSKRCEMLFMQQKNGNQRVCSEVQVVCAGCGQ